MKKSSTKINFSYLLTLIIFSVVSFVLPSVANAYTYNVKLTPANNLAENYVGRGGFFSSNDVYRDYKTPKYNFTFLDNMILAIDNITGNGKITGTMANGANSNDKWAFDLTLNGLVFKDKNGQYFHGNTKPYDQMINDIIAIPNADNNQQYGQGGYGIEWASSQLNIRDLNSGSAFPGVTTYVGKNDPAASHNNVAELHNWQGQLYFGAWWMGASAPSWFADTKAWGTNLGYDKPSVLPPTTPIPEPASLALISLAGLGMLKRKRAA